MKIIVYENGPFMVNTYLVVNENLNQGIIIDPGTEADSLLDEIEKDNIKLTAIFVTHGHIDHIDGVNNVKNRFNIPLYAAEAEKGIINAVSYQARMFGVSDPGEVIIDSILPLTGEIESAGLKFQILHTPGHSAGSISFYIDGNVICGDALFNFSIGRTDLPGGNYDQLITAIKEKLFTLPAETRVLPGHGPETTIENEIKMNPFFR